MEGLRRRQLRSIDVLATAVAATKPAVTSLIAPIVVVSYVGPGAWLSIVVATLVALLLRSVIAEFTARVATAGSLYTFVVRALGAWPGLVTATAMLTAYALAAGYALTSVGLVIRAMTTQPGPVPTAYGAADVWVVAVVGVCCALVLLRRVTTFTTMTLAFEAVGLAVAAGLVVAVLHRGGDLAAAVSLTGAEPGKVLGGATIMLALLVGFEIPASYGAEAARPFKSVPMAMRASLLVAGALTLVTTIAVAADPTVWLAGFPASVRVENLWFPGGDTLYVWLIRVARALCLTAAALAFWSAVARLSFVLALEGALPRWLARTDDADSGPKTAVLCSAPFVAGPGLILVATDDRIRHVLASLVDAAGLLMMIAYLLVCVAVPVFLDRIGELSLRPLLTSAATGVLMLIAMASNLNWMHERGSVTLVVIVAGAVLPVATLWYGALRRQHPGVFERMGLHDQTIADDTLHPAKGLDPDISG